MRFVARAVLGVLSGLIAGAAGAETLPVAGIYAAGEDAPAEITMVVIEPFGGEAGESLAFAIEDRLRRATVGGEPWFQVSLNSQTQNVVVIIDDRYSAEGKVTSGRSSSDGVMRGTASIEVTDQPAGTKTIEECVERDANDKCIRREERQVRCRARAVSLRPELRLIARGGRTLYGLRDLLRREQRYCADERVIPSTDAMAEEMIEEIAARVRFDIVPVERADDIRVLESRSKIAKEDRNAFRDAVRLLNSDSDAACRAFAALEPTNPADVSLLFNLGLCRESAGELDLAEDYYRRVLAIESKSNAVEGMDRIASRRRAERQLEVHRGA